jgi:hypothetical protein
MTHVNRRRFLKAASGASDALALGADRLFASQGAAANANAEIMLGDYVANRVVGKDENPELAAIFKLKDRGF